MASCRQTCGTSCTASTAVDLRRSSGKGRFHRPSHQRLCRHPRHHSQKVGDGNGCNVLREREEECVFVCVCVCVRACVRVCGVVCVRVCWQLWSVPFQMYSVQFRHVSHIRHFLYNQLKVSNVSDLVFELKKKKERKRVIFRMKDMSGP